MNSIASRRRERTLVFALCFTMTVLLVAAVPESEAVHFYRSTELGCSANSGNVTDDPLPSGPIGATVLMLHNTFHDTATGGPITVIQKGQAVKWEWRSAHCHSVQHIDEAQDIFRDYPNNTITNASFYSGYHFPTAVPGTPQAIPGFFEYPVPESSATLSYTHTFTEGGEFQYRCEHHGVIGMVGTVIVLE